MATSVSRYYDVDVWSSEDEDGGALWQGAEAGLENSVGVEFEPTQNLTELVDGVHDEAARYRRRWLDSQVRWLEGREPATEFLAAAQAVGITLP